MKKHSIPIVTAMLILLFGGVYAATNFPENLDVFTDQTSSDLITSAKWNNLQDSIEALEEKVGADNSDVTTSHDYKLAELATTMGLVQDDITELATTMGALATTLGVVQTTLGLVKTDVYAATSTPTADTIAKFNSDGIMKGAELNMTDEAADEASAYEVTLDLGSVKKGDVVFLQGYSRVGWSSAPTSINLSIGYKSGTSYLKYFNEETTPLPLQYLTAPIIPTGTASSGAISGIGTVDQDGTLVVRAFVSSSGGTSLTYQTKIRAFFLKKQ